MHLRPFRCRLDGSLIGRTSNTVRPISVWHILPIMCGRLDSLPHNICASEHLDNILETKRVGVQNCNAACLGLAHIHLGARMAKNSKRRGRPSARVGLCMLAV